MKKKLIIGLIIAIVLCMGYGYVHAFEGVKNEGDHITLPQGISVDGNVGKGTLHVKNLSSYTLSYQFVVLSSSTLQQINNKYDEYENYADEVRENIAKLNAKVDTATKNYRDIKNSSTATQAEKDAAYEAYSAAIDEYNAYNESSGKELDKLYNAYLASIPNYNNSNWTTVNGSGSTNEITLNFTNRSGSIDYILWAKVNDGSKDYYNFAHYSSSVKAEETLTISETSATLTVGETKQLSAESSVNADIKWSSSDEKIATVSSNGLVTAKQAGKVVITAKANDKSAICNITVNAKEEQKQEEKKEEQKQEEKKEQTKFDLTDFSKATFKLEKYGIAQANLIISGVTPKENRSYYLVLSNDSNKPTKKYDDLSRARELISLKYDSDKKVLYSNNSDYVANYVERTGKIYASILEYVDSSKNENIPYGSNDYAIYGKELKRYDEPKYIEGFTDSSHVTHDSTQIITSFTHGSENVRKLYIKIGKITDTSILQKIKNQDSSGFADLLKYAKSNKGDIIDGKYDANKGYNFLEYNSNDTSENKPVLDISKTEGDAYYFLYVSGDTENGKYIEQEAVTLANCHAYDNGNRYLFFYGKDDFTWADFGSVPTTTETKKDNTVADGKIPQTGETVTIFAALGITLIVGTIGIVKYRKNNF